MLHHVRSFEEENNGEEFHMRDLGSSGMTQDWDAEQEEDVGFEDQLQRAGVECQTSRQKG